jgi:NitT/TauT family transport system ATP-binding protein
MRSTACRRSERWTVRLDIRDLGIRFHTGVEAVRGLDLTVASGEFVAIVGPSGCGKSTVLNAIASLLTPDDASVGGTILADGVDVCSLSARELNFGYVFQRDNLLPWRTVEANIAIGLEIRGIPAHQRRARVDELLALGGLTGFERAHPHQLSGGMRQRAAVLRAMAYRPRLILMDEPFGALDAQTRLGLQATLLQMWEHNRTTILFVTHDLTEAILLAQRVVLFSKRPGTVRQISTIDLPYPRDPFALRGDRRFAALETELWQLLQHDYRDSSAA